MLSSRTQQKQTNKALSPKFWVQLWILDRLVILQNIKILKHSWFWLLLLLIFYSFFFSQEPQLSRVICAHASKQEEYPSWYEWKVLLKPHCTTNISFTHQLWVINMPKLFNISHTDTLVEYQTIPPFKYGPCILRFPFIEETIKLLHLSKQVVFRSLVS